MTNCDANRMNFLRYAAFANVSQSGSISIMKVGRKSAASGQESGSKDTNPTAPGSDPHADAADSRAPSIARSKASGKGVKRGFLDGAVGWDVAFGNAKEVWLKYELLEKLNRERRTA